jgi:hypothetical protein
MKLALACTRVAVSTLAVASPAHADRVVGLDLAGLYANPNKSGVGVGGYASAALRFGGGDEAWVEPGVTLRVSQVQWGSSSFTAVEPMIGVRLGTDAGSYRPWMGGYIGYANQLQTIGDDDSMLYTGLALDGAIGVDVALCNQRTLVFRLDVNHDEMTRSFGSSTWFGLGVGMRWDL